MNVRSGENLIDLFKELMISFRNRGKAYLLEKSEIVHTSTVRIFLPGQPLVRSGFGEIGQVLDSWKVSAQV